MNAPSIAAVIHPGMRSRIPGLLLALAIGLLALLLGRWVPLIGGPVFGIVLGVVVRALFAPDARFTPGIQFGGTQVLQWSIIALGFGLSLTQVAKTGVQSLAVTAVTMSTAFLTAWLPGCLVAGPLARRSRPAEDPDRRGHRHLRRLGDCGDHSDHPPRRPRYGVRHLHHLPVQSGRRTAVSAAGHLMHMSDLGFGLWAGAAINDTSSVIAAGYSYSHAAGDYATIVKLTRAPP
jgi:uncharacterized membrane protein YadS